MSTIRRQSIISSGLVYFGFGLGFLYTILITKAFSPAQYGLIAIFLALASVMYSFANLGTQSYVYKFYPYYKGNLPDRKNDLMSWALAASLVGFLLVLAAGLIFKGLVIRKFSAQSPELVKYYYWTFVFGFGLTLFSLLEAFAWQLKHSILTNYLREIQFRLFTIILVVLSLVGLLKNFDTFIKIYAFNYLLIALSLLAYLLISRQMHFCFQPSRVTKKFLRKIVLQASLVWSGGVFFTVSFFFAQIVIAAVIPGGLEFVGIYSLAQYIASLIQAPQRGVISASLGPLSQAWRDKDLGKINRIYERSSINQLIFSVGMFILIWINFKDGVTTFHFKNEYLNARYVFLFIGLTRIVDMGTGLNSHIIVTSTFWRFDFFTGIILIAITLPMNYILTREEGFIGPAIADLITFTIYNALRWLFLYRKFGMQPFTVKTLYTLLLGFTGYFICDRLFAHFQGFFAILSRSMVFIAFYGAGVLVFRLSEDVLPVWRTLKKKLAGAFGFLE